MPDSFLLLLNFLFFDSPGRIFSLYKQFLTLDIFKKQFSLWLQKHSFSSDQKAWLQRRLEAFDEVLIRQELKRLGIFYVTYLDDRYPECLKQVNDFPPVLFYQGNLAHLSSRILGVVGSRQASSYANQVMSSLLPELFSHFILASGLAAGVDSWAHEICLMRHQPTIAVVAHGLDMTYPTQNQELHQSIAKTGLVLSEYPPQIRPDKYRFPRRNRLISGISVGVLVVEAAEKSGALITAQLAADQNREVFAVPGSFFSSKSAGCHRLIQQGAKLVFSADDILNEFPDQLSLFPLQKVLSVEPRLDLSGYENELVNYLGQASLSVDDLVEKTGSSVSQVTTTLTMLELKGVVTALGSNRFSQCRS